jgi:hypothetical protein
MLEFSPNSPDPTPPHLTRNYFPAVNLNGEAAYVNHARNRRLPAESTLLDRQEWIRATYNMEGVAEIVLLLIAVLEADQDRARRARRHLVRSAPYMLDKSDPATANAMRTETTQPT